MSYTPKMKITVHALDATWVFKPLGSEHVTGAQTNPTGICADVFNDCLIAWEDVLNDDGSARPCTAEERKAIPFVDKAVVVAQLLREVGLIDAEGEDSGAPPT